MNQETKLNDKKNELIYLGMPPLETFMNVPSRFRKEHLFKVINCFIDTNLSYFFIVNNNNKTSILSLVI